MESITRNVGDLSQAERQAYEALLGHELHAGQKIIIQLMDVGAGDHKSVKEVSVDQTPPDASVQNSGPAKLPDWCSVFAGLSDAEVEEVEKSILARGKSTRNVNLDF